MISECSNDTTKISKWGGVADTDPKCKSQEQIDNWIQKHAKTLRLKTLQQKIDLTKPYGEKPTFIAYKLVDSLSLDKNMFQFINLDMTHN